MIKLLYPCKCGWGSQEYKPNQHYGLDFGWITSDDDDSIIACEDGVVTYCGTYKYTQNGKTYSPIMVILRHSNIDTEYDYYSLYTHLDAVCCSLKDEIIKGEIIGVKGNTGNSSGKHLHFQFMRVAKGQSLNGWNKCAIDPTPYLYRTANQIYKEDSSRFSIPMEEDEMGLVKIEKDENTYDYMWSVVADGGKVHPLSWFKDQELLNQGYEEVLAVNGGMFYSYEGSYYPNGLEKHQGVNDFPTDMSCVTDYKDAWSIGCMSNGHFMLNQQKYIVSDLDKYRGAITGYTSMLNSKNVLIGTKQFSSQYSAISGRTIIGEDKDGNFLSYSIEGVTGKSGLYGASIYSKMKNLGFYNYIILDGGGSVCRRLNGKDDITTSRSIKNALLLYRKKKVVEPSEDIESLKKQLAEKDEEISTLKKQLEESEKTITTLKQLNSACDSACKVLNDKIDKIKEIVK